MRYLCISAVLLWVFGLAAGQAWPKQLLWQTNAEGDDIHIYDIETAALVRHLIVGANPHGIAWAAGSETIFVSLEHNGMPNGELLWIDKESFAIQHRLKVGPEPHAIAVTPDGRWVYVPCRDGSYWVVDTLMRETVMKITTGGRPHNTTVSPDGKHAFLSPMGAPKKVTIIDPLQNHRVIGTIPFSQSVRPPALAASRKLFFQHVDGLNGFEAADLETRKVIARIEHNTSLGVPVIPAAAGFLSLSGLSRCHGLGVRPGDEEIWSLCGANATIHDITTLSFTETAHIELPGKAYWLTFSASGDKVFVALSENSQVAVIDADLRKILKVLQAGDYPKRNIVVTY